MKLLIRGIAAVVAVFMTLFVGLALFLVITFWRDRSVAETADLVLDISYVDTVGEEPILVPATSVLPETVAIVCSFGPYFMLDNPSIAEQSSFASDLDLIAQAASDLEFSFSPARPWIGENQALSVYFDADRMMIGHDWFNSYLRFHREHWRAVFSDRSIVNDATTVYGCEDVSALEVSVVAGTRARYVQFIRAP